MGASDFTDSTVAKSRSLFHTSRHASSPPSSYISLKAWYVRSSIVDIVYEHSRSPGYPLCLTDLPAHRPRPYLVDLDALLDAVGVYTRSD